MDTVVANIWNDCGIVKVFQEQAVLVPGQNSIHLWNCECEPKSLLKNPAGARDRESQEVEHNGGSCHSTTHGWNRRTVHLEERNMLLGG